MDKIKMNKILTIILIVGIVLYFVISKGYETKKDYDESQIRIAEVLNYLHTITEDEFNSIVNKESGKELFLSDEFRAQLIGSIHTVSSYGPSHPLTIDVFTLKFNSFEYIVELRHANIHDGEQVYLNVIIEDKKREIYKESRYSSEELNTWAKDMGIVQ